MSTTDTEPTPTIDTPAAEILEVGQSLNANERCDRCGAQSYVEVETLEGGNLLFCSHHYTKHKDALKVKAKRIVDHTKVLLEMEGRLRTMD